MGGVFANGPGNLGSLPDRVIPKIFKKWYLIPPGLTLSIIRYVSRVKWNNLGKGVAPSPTTCCSSYWKRSLRVTLDYSRQLYLSAFLLGPFEWGCRIHRLYLSRGVRTPPPPNQCPGYDTKQSNGEFPVMLKLWEIRSTSLLPSLEGPLRPGVKAPDRVLTNRTKQCTYAKLNCLVWFYGTSTIVGY